MYKIGDKVETPQFTGIVEKVYESGVKVNGKMFPLKDIKPYRTAHEKLIEMGYEEKIHDTVVKSDVESGRYKQYAKNYEVILIDVENREFTTYTLYNGDKGVSDVSWVSHELSRILTQYLEEMEGKE
jgi:hypothetical protein